jgi:hypothetical protein
MDVICEVGLPKLLPYMGTKFSFIIRFMIATTQDNNLHDQLFQSNGSEHLPPDESIRAVNKSIKVTLASDGSGYQVSIYRHKY